MYGYWAGSKFGLHQLPIVSSIVQSVAGDPSVLPKVSDISLLRPSTLVGKKEAWEIFLGYNSNLILSRVQLPTRQLEKCRPKLEDFIFESYFDFLLVFLIPAGVKHEEGHAHEQ